MRFRLITAVLIITGSWLLTATPHAQSSHPCDSTPTSATIRPTTLFGVGFCHTLKDRAGNKTPETVPKTARILIDDVERYNGPIDPQGAPNAFGLTYFETPRTITLAVGTHAVKMFVSNSVIPGESDAGTFSITVAPALTRADTPSRGRAVLAVQ